MELEELLSAYVDNELSPQNRKKVEALVKTDAQAKSILDGYMFVRKVLQREAKSLRYKVPTGFAARVLAAIDAQAPRSKTFGSVRYGILSRLRNPRMIAYPLAVLICALLIGIFYRPADQQTADGRRQTAVQTADGGQQTADSSQQAESIIPPPLSEGAGTVSQSEIPAQPEVTDIKLVCRVKDTASASMVFVRVFAKHEVPSTRSTSGSTNTVVYEISVTPDTLRIILDDLRANSVEITGKTDDLSTEKPVKVFFQIE